MIIKVSKKSQKKWCKMSISNQKQSLWLPTLMVVVIAASLLLLLLSPPGLMVEAATSDGQKSEMIAANANADKAEFTVGGFRLSKLFDFGEYKRIYRKKYTTVVQEMARMKLYLGGVLKVLIAAIKHRFLGKRYYLAINRMTDWTEDEWRQLSVPASVLKGESRPTEASKTSSDEQGNDEGKHFEATDLADIDTNLAKKFEGQEETFQMFIDEIVNEQDDEATGEHHESKLRARMLFREPDAGSIHSVPKSNNPRYEKPQVMSQSDTSEQTEKPLDSSDAEKIGESKGLLDSILDGLSFFTNEIAGDTGDSDRKVEVYSDGPDTIFVDHRESGCLLPPNHQFDCGSCYAFASMALYEYLYCMQQSAGGREKKQPVRFSIQYVVDCGPQRASHLFGCKGGNPIVVADFVNKYGLELDANYPYAGEAQVCPYAPHEDPTKMGYIRVNESGLQQLKPIDFDDMLMKQPVLINIYPGADLKAYGGGIYDNYGCGYEYAHAMLLVGRGRKDQQEYWIIRNSLGTEWGDHGYLHISKGAALNCLVDDGTTSHANFPSAGALNPKYTKMDMEKLSKLLNTHIESR